MIALAIEYRQAEKNTPPVSVYSRNNVLGLIRPGPGFYN